jgi:hypothetical protein
VLLRDWAHLVSHPLLDLIERLALSPVEHEACCREKSGKAGKERLSVPEAVCTI